MAESFEHKVQSGWLCLHSPVSLAVHGAFEPRCLGAKCQSISLHVTAGIPKSYQYVQVLSSIAGLQLNLTSGMQASAAKLSIAMLFV